MYEKPDKFIPALYGGIIIGFISSIPFLNLINCICCAGVMLGGLLAVYFYKENFTPATPPFTSGDCLSLGVYAGLIGALVTTVLNVLILLLFGNVMGDFILKTIQEMDLQIPEESLTAIENAFQQTLSVSTILINLVSSVIIERKQ